MKKNGRCPYFVLIFVLSLCFIIDFAFNAEAASFNDVVSGNWNDGATWDNTSPGVEGTDWPGSGDDVTVDSHTVTLTTSRPCTSLVVSGGTIDCATYTLTASAGGTFSSGNVNNGEFVVQGAASTATYSGTTFGANVTSASGQLYINGSTFNGTATLEKTGSGTNNGTGGNTFTSTTTIADSGSGTLRLGVGNPDTFNGELICNNTGTGQIELAEASTGTQFNENIVLNSTAGTGITFGDNNGTSTLADGKTITIGGSGFSSGELQFHGFTQTGSTAQALTLTGTSILYLYSDTTFNGNVNFASPQLYINGSTFNGSATLEKTGATTNYGSGVSTFNSTLTLINSGSGQIGLQGEFDENITVNNTSSGGIYFGASTGESILADGKSVTLGGSGFSGGTLSFKDFTQTGSTAQSLTLTGTATLDLEDGTTFNGNVVFTAPVMDLDGATFNGTATFDSTGDSTNNAVGGCTFNSTTTITNSGDGSWRLAVVSPDIFNDQVTFTNSGASYLAPAENSAGNQFNDNIIVNSTAGVGVLFGQNSGTSTLADGMTITIGGSDFTVGTLRLKGFTQTGGTAQTFTLTGTAVAEFDVNSTWNGNVTCAAPSILLDGTIFNGTVSFNKTGTAMSAGQGGNTFASTATFENSNTGVLELGNDAGDDFNGDVTFILNSAGHLRVGYRSYTNTFAGNVTTTTSAGTLSYGLDGGTMEFDKTSETQTLDSGGKTIPILTHTGAGTVQLTGNNLTVSTTLTNSAGIFDLNDLDLTVTGATFTNSATIKLTGDETISDAPTLNAGSIVDYSAGATSRAIKNWTYTNAIVKTSGAGTFELPAALDCAGIDITVGTLDVTTDNYNINVSGDWNNDATFTARSGTVFFDGTNQTISGSTTFNNFSKTDASDNAADLILTFDNTGTQTISGLLTLDGLDDTDRVNLVSDLPDTQWSLTCNGTFAVDYVDVQDSDASGGNTIQHTNSEDSGNNLNWGFTNTWDGEGSDDNWTTVENWAGDTVPTTIEIAVIPNGATVIFNKDDATATCWGITIEAGGELEFDTSDDRTLIVKGDINVYGTLTMRAGSAFTSTIKFDNSTNAQHGLNVQGTGFLDVQGGSLTNQNCVITTVGQTNGTDNAYIYLKEASQTILKYAEISYMGKNALTKFGINVFYVDGDTSGQGAIIEGCKIHDGYQGIRPYAGGYHVIRKNTIYSNTHHGMAIYSDNDIVTDNLVYSNGAVGIYMEGADFNTVRSNISYNNTGEGIYLCGATNNYIYNNVSSNNDKDGIRVYWTSTGNILKNNILYDNGDEAHEREIYVQDAASQIGFVSDYNIIFNGAAGHAGYWDGASRTTLDNWKTASSQGANSIDSDPDFVVDDDPADADFMYVNADSPALGAGCDPVSDTAQAQTNIGARLGYVYNSTDTKKFNWIQAADDDAGLAAGETVTIYAVDMVSTATVQASGGVTDNGEYLTLTLDEGVISNDDDYVGLYYYVTSGDNAGEYYLILDSADVAGPADTISILTASDNNFASDVGKIVDRVYTKKAHAEANFSLTKSGVTDWITWDVSGSVIVDAESVRDYNVYADAALDKTRLNKSIKLLNYTISDLGGKAVTDQSGSYYEWEVEAEDNAPFFGINF